VSAIFYMADVPGNNLLLEVSTYSLSFDIV
jgi:hypothetical protein